MDARAKIIDSFKNGLIVSVQAQDNEPLNKPEHLLALSESALEGGACALRLCGIENINYVKKEVGDEVPIIGLTKLEPTPFNFLDVVYITATMKDVENLLVTGIDCIALDGTSRERQDKSTLKQQIDLIKKSKKIVVADVSTFEEGVAAADLGADIISTTLSGYTKYTRQAVNEGPDLDLLADLTEDVEIPVFMEGRVWEMEDVREAFELGAFSVVIGSAITRPQKITKRFLSAVPLEGEV